MSQSYLKIVRGSAWFTETYASAEKIPANWLSWLQDKGSLTTALTQFSEGNFQVRVLSERWQKPFAHEALALGVRPSLVARIREVELLCHGEVMVFARSLIPLTLYRQERHTFEGMGSKPLGHLLFQNGRARYRRRSLSVYPAAGRSPIYGRATPYAYRGGNILVCEFFVNPGLVGEG